jgi:hypothetical protein
MVHIFFIHYDFVIIVQQHKIVILCRINRFEYFCTCHLLLFEMPPRFKRPAPPPAGAADKDEDDDDSFFTRNKAGWSGVKVEKSCKRGMVFS